MVLLSGHLDSWDVGQGAMDDGGGAMISWEALSLIKDLGNRRTKHSVTQANPKSIIDFIFFLPVFHIETSSWWSVLPFPVVSNYNNYQL